MAMAQNSAVTELDRLIQTLGGVEGQNAPGSSAPLANQQQSNATGGDGAGESVGDAIDEVLRQPARVSAAVSLREAPEVVAFRDELVSGLIRVDTARQLLQLVNEVILRLMRG